MLIHFGNDLVLSQTPTRKVDGYKCGNTKKNKNEKLHNFEQFFSAKGKTLKRYAADERFSTYCEKRKQNDTKVIKSPPRKV